MFPSSDKRNTAFGFQSHLDEIPAIQPSPPHISQKDEAIELSKKRMRSPIREQPGESLNYRQESRLRTTQREPYLKHESPWDFYRKVFGCELAGDAVVVVHKSTPANVRFMRSYPVGIADQMLQWFRQLRHPNVMSAEECFSTPTSFYAICEDLPVTLEDLVVCRAYPTEAQLAVIMRQILAGVSFLTDGGLEHRSLNSSNILVGCDGVVKIGFLEDVRRRDANGDHRETLRALETITKELMEKHNKKDGAAGVNDLKRWPADSDAVKFLAATESVSSVDELRQHPFITKCHGSESELVGLARFALVSTGTFYSYP